MMKYKGSLTICLMFSCNATSMPLGDKPMATHYNTSLQVMDKGLPPSQVRKQMDLNEMGDS